MYLSLLQIGIKDLFKREDANLLGMFYHLLYVTKLIQKAEIEVNEEGTVATAASGKSYLKYIVVVYFLTKFVSILYRQNIGQKYEK